MKKATHTTTIKEDLIIEFSSILSDIATESFSSSSNGTDDVMLISEFPCVVDCWNDRY